MAMASDDLGEECAIEFPGEGMDFYGAERWYTNWIEYFDLKDTSGELAAGA